MVSHRGMKISESDRAIFIEHAGAWMRKLRVLEPESQDISVFDLSLKKDIVEVSFNSGMMGFGRRDCFDSHMNINI